MTRIAIVVAGGLAVAGCSSFSLTDLMPSLSSGGGGYALALVSEPPGAEARTSLGPSCQTPCSVTLTGREDFTVTFTLPGYQSQTLPVTLERAGTRALGSELLTAVQFAPNPLVAQLEPVAPPRAKKKIKPKPRAAAKDPPAAGAAPTGASTGADVPASQRTIPGAAPTVPASAWPPPSR
jgi:hypothetical protein